VRVNEGTSGIGISDFSSENRGKDINMNNAKIMIILSFLLTIIVSYFLLISNMISNMEKFVYPKRENDRFNR
jgi:hypothetical protein